MIDEEIKNEIHSLHKQISCNLIRLGIADIYYMSVREISKRFPWEKLRSFLKKEDSSSEGNLKRHVVCYFFDPER